jgi:hypothetical protein
VSRFLRWAGWLPAFIVGMSAAVAGELSIGLLLYSTPGFIRSLTLILAILLGSLALGLWTAPTAATETLHESLRRRWLLALVAFGGGSALSGMWSIQRGLAADATTRGLGLALLAALPLYACGALLGAMAGPDPERRAGIGSSAVAGAALGAILAGYVLVSTLLPVAIYAFCLVLLSGGALVHGWIVNERGERTVVESAASPFGELTVEEWWWGKSRGVRLLVLNGRTVAAEDTRGAPIRAWERAALDLLSRRPARDEKSEVLAIGGGSLALVRQLLEARHDVSATIVERSRPLVELALKHFSPPDRERLQVLHQRPFSLYNLSGPYEAVLLDSPTAAPGDPVPLMGGGALASIRERLATDGLLIFGGLDAEHAQGLPLEALLEEGREIFPVAAVYRSATSANGRGSADTSLLVVYTCDRAAQFPESVDELRLDAVHRVEAAEESSRSLALAPVPADPVPSDPVPADPASLTVAEVEGQVEAPTAGDNASASAEVDSRSSDSETP